MCEGSGKVRMWLKVLRDVCSLSVAQGLSEGTDMRLAKSDICNSNWQVKNSDGET